MQGTDYDWAQFLGRVPEAVDTNTLQNRLRGKAVTITGAGGFIGSALARALSRFTLKRLVLIDIVEQGLHELEQALITSGSSLDRSRIVGDVCDRPLLSEVFQKHPPDVVFHAAASKHVWLMESNPLTAARNNILGTHSVLQAAGDAHAQDFVLVSTDKAVDPQSIMGATKRAAELLAQQYHGAMRARTVRLGNVLGSTGSVVPVFEKQIECGQALTVTDPACMRYFFSIDEVVQSLLASLLIDEAPSLLISRADKQFSILSVAGFQASQHGRSLGSLGVIYTGLRPGEKVTEAMLSKDENAEATLVNALRMVRSILPLPARDLQRTIESLQQAVHSRDVRGLLLALAELLPDYRPSSALTAEMETATSGSTA